MLLKLLPGAALLREELEEAVGEARAAEELHERLDAVGGHKGGEEVGDEARHGAARHEAVLQRGWEHAVGEYADLEREAASHRDRNFLAPLLVVKLQ